MAQIILPPAPSTLLELEEHFGRPFHDPEFEAEHIVRIPITLQNGKVVHIACHRVIAMRVTWIFAHLQSTGHLALVKTYDGCFNIRKVRGSSRPSLHAWGLAIDLNAGEFPLGSHSQQAPALVQAFTAEGFFSGARFHRPDPMHFQYTTGPM